MKRNGRMWHFYALRIQLTRKRREVAKPQAVWTRPPGLDWRYASGHGANNVFRSQLQKRLWLRTLSAIRTYARSEVAARK